jgi:hypothetical protein
LKHRYSPQTAINELIEGINEDDEFLEFIKSRSQSLDPIIHQSASMINQSVPIMNQSVPIMNQSAHIVNR